MVEMVVPRVVLIDYDYSDQYNRRRAPRRYGPESARKVRRQNYGIIGSKTRKGIVKAVNDVSYELEPGRTVGIVGESGSGKSVSAMSILRLLDGNGYIDSGEILFEGKDLTKLKIDELYKIRGDKISVIFQEPMTSLNPVFTVKKQLADPFIIQRGMKKKQAYS